MSGPLPFGWEAKQTADGRWFFIDHQREKTTWEDPRLKPKQPNIIMPGWEAQQTQDGRWFFIDHHTGSTTWDDPRLSNPRNITSPNITPASNLGPLPLGWEMKRLQDGRCFFIDHNTESTTWQDPRTMLVQPAAPKPTPQPRFSMPLSPQPTPSPRPAANFNASAAPQLGPLPPGWEMALTNDGRVYFANTVTKTTTWEDPRSANVSPGTPGSVPLGSLGQLPPGWEMRLTNEGKLYFVNHDTRQTTWDDPRLKNTGVSLPTRSLTLVQTVDLDDLEVIPEQTGEYFGSIICSGFAFGIYCKDYYYVVISISFLISNNNSASNYRILCPPDLQVF